MNRPAYLCVEVWIGPMEGLRHVEKAGERARGRVYIGRQVANKKLGVENHLVLPHEPGVSGSHAELRFQDGRVFVKDLGSTNGTFVGGQRISEETEIFSGDVFVAGFTPLRVSLEEDPEGALPPCRVISDDSWAGPGLRGAFQRARAAAQRRGEGFIDTRHLCDSALRLPSPEIDEALRDAGFSREDALVQLWDGGMLLESNALLRGILQRAQKPPTPGEFLVSPKAVGCVDVTLRLEHFVRGEAELARELFRCMLKDRHGPVGTWLRARGVKMRPLAGAPPMPEPASSVPTRTKTTRVRTRGGGKEAKTDSARYVVPAAPAVAAAPAAHAARTPSAAAARAGAPPRADVVLDQQARELADELVHLAVAYRFSTPADRRAVLKGRITKEMNRVAPEKRGAIVEQVRVQFPVARQEADSDQEVLRLRRRVADLEKQLERAAQRPAAAPSPAAASRPAQAFAWRELADRSGPASSPGVAMMRELVNFAVNLERFVLGLVESTTTPGSTTTSFRLPNFKENIEGALVALKDGREPEVERLRSYLGDLQRWQVAIQAAHYEAPRLWFARIWKRINPSAIEAVTREGGWKLRGEAADWWNLYRQLVKDLSPELVQDQILHMVSEVAQEEHAKLKRGNRKDE